MTGRRGKRTSGHHAIAGIRRRVADVAGMTLIELIVGLAISSVVSLMAAQFFSIAVRLHRSSTEISALQKEAQTALTQITRAVMGAEEVYFHDNGQESVLVLGRETAGGAGFTGQIFYYDRRERKLYADVGYDEKVSKDALFSSLRVQAEVGRIATAEYLISNKVEELTFSLSRDVKEMQSLGNHRYGNDGALCITAGMTMQYHESRSYDYTARAMTRERIAEITWNDNH